MTGDRQYGWLMLDIYEDTGCADLGIPSCLSCWLPACRYDLAPKQAGAMVRAARVRVLLRQGLTAEEIAADLHTSRRTVYRLKHWIRQWGAVLPESGR